MLRDERMRTLIFAVLFTIASVVMIIALIATGETKALIGLGMFGVLALVEWLKLLVDG